MKALAIVRVLARNVAFAPDRDCGDERILAAYIRRAPERLHDRLWREARRAMRANKSLG